MGKTGQKEPVLAERWQPAVSASAVRTTRRGASRQRGTAPGSGPPAGHRGGSGRRCPPCQTPRDVASRAGPPERRTPDTDPRRPCRGNRRGRAAVPPGAGDAHGDPLDGERPRRCPLGALVADAHTDTPPGAAGEVFGRLAQPRLEVVQDDLRPLMQPFHVSPAPSVDARFGRHLRAATQGVLPAIGASRQSFARIGLIRVHLRVHRFCSASLTWGNHPDGVLARAAATPPPPADRPRPRVVPALSARRSVAAGWTGRHGPPPCATAPVGKTGQKWRFPADGGGPAVGSRNPRGPQRGASRPHGATPGPWPTTRTPRRLFAHASSMAKTRGPCPSCRSRQQATAGWAPGTLRHIR